MEHQFDMIFPIYKEAVQTDRIRKTDNELFLFKDEDSQPIAFRSCDINDPAIPDLALDKLLFEIGAFSFYEGGNCIYFLYHGARRIVGCISPLDRTLRDERMARDIELYFRKAYSLDPYAVSLRTAFVGFGELVSSAAEFCGCLTDIMSDDPESSCFSQYQISVDNTGCEHIAVALPILALMFRRISALRGFNFKITLKDSLPCLIFSAKILIEEIGKIKAPDDIREYSALTDILGDNGMIVDARIRELDGDEKLHRLSIVLCPQTVDPRGILRAPVWRQQAKRIIDSIDVDLDGKY